MEKESIFLIEANGRTFCGNIFEKSVCLGVDLGCNCVVEKQSVGNREKLILHIWEASLVDGKYLREIFYENEDIVEWLDDNCREFNKVFVYVPQNKLLSGDDKRDFLSIDGFAAIKVISKKDLTSILENQEIN